MNLYNYSVYDLYIFQLYRKLNGFLFSLFFSHWFQQLIVFSLFHSTAISLSNYSGRLKHLDISSCHQITDNSLSALRLVATLILFTQGTCNSMVKERSMCCFVVMMMIMMMTMAALQVIIWFPFAIIDI